MAGFLNIVNGDTKATRLQVLENTEPMDITGASLSCIVASSPRVAVSATIVDAENGEATVALGAVPVGSWEACITITDGSGKQTSEYFVVNSRAAL